MQAMKSFEWAQDKVDSCVYPTREQREGHAAQRRLRQMAKKREKQAKREANRLAAMQQNAAIPNGDG